MIELQVLCSFKLQLNSSNYGGAGEIMFICRQINIKIALIYLEDLQLASTLQGYLCYCKVLLSQDGKFSVPSLKWYAV